MDQHPRELFLKLGLTHGSRAEVTITNDTRTLYKNIMVYARSFADVNVGEPLLYVNSLDCVAVAINQGSFSKAYNIGTASPGALRCARLRASSMNERPPRGGPRLP